MSDDTPHPDDTDPLDELIARLDGAAEQLRSGELSADGAATLVEECAVLANRAGIELERRARANRSGDPAELDRPAPVPGQGSLL